MSITSYTKAKLDQLLAGKADASALAAKADTSALTAETNRAQTTETALTPVDQGDGTVKLAGSLIAYLKAKADTLLAAKADLVAGVVPTAQIPNLDAGKITTGTLPAARIGDLSATYVPKAHGLSVKPATFHTTDYMLNNLALIGVDSHGRGYFTNHAGGIFQSDNGMPNLGVYPGDRTANKGIPAGTANNGPSVIVEFKGSLYLMTNLTDGSAQVVSQAARSDGDTLFSWTNVLTMTSGSQVGGGAAVLAQDGAYIYAAEYRDPVGGPSAYRSADGTTWTKVFGPAASNRHIHAIAPDPYNPGHVWMTLGDGGQYYILHSTDYGSTWTEMAPAADAPNWQALQISFSSTHIWFAADNRFSTCFIYERSTGTFKDATPNTHRHIAVPGPVPRNGPNYVTDGAFTSGSTTMTSATAAFTQADVGREVHNTNLPGGRSWIVTVSSATSVILFDKASTTASAQPVAFGDEQFYANAPFGAVEPTSGYYYCMASLGTGQRVGWFYTAGPGEPIYLLDPMAQISYGAGLDQIIFWKGYAWGGVTRTKLRA